MRRNSSTNESSAASAVASAVDTAVSSSSISQKTKAKEEICICCCFENDLLLAVTWEAKEEVVAFLDFEGRKA